MPPAHIVFQIWSTLDFSAPVIMIPYESPSVLEPMGR